MIRNCPSCNSDSFSLFYSSKYSFIPGLDTGLELKVGQCNFCKMAYIPTYIEESQLEVFYSTFSNYEYTEVNHWPKDDKLKSNRQFEYLKKFLSSDSFVVDFGCSLGYTLSLFQNSGFKTLGVETSPTAAEYARDNFNVKVESLFFHDKMVFDHPEVDLFILSHVLEHIWNPKALLQTLKKHLSENGLIYVEIPLLDVFEDSRDPMPFTLEHVNYFSLDTMKYLLNVSGLRLRDFTLIHNLEGEAPNYTVGGFLIERDSVGEHEKSFAFNGLLEHKVKPSQLRKTKWESWLYKNSQKNVVVWGAGNMGIQFYSMSSQKIKIIDGNPKKQFRNSEIQVLSPTDIVWNDVQFVVISSFGAFDTIERILTEEVKFNGEIVNLFDI